MAAGSTRYLLMRAAVCSGQVVKYPSLIACRKIDRAGTPAHACRKAMHSPMVLAAMADMAMCCVAVNIGTLPRLAVHNPVLGSRSPWCAA